MWRSKKQIKLNHRLIDAGADLIIGHGAHMMQEIERYRGCWIIYSLGNFMFNSPGRYKELNLEPFSLVAQLVLQERDGHLVKTIKLYPILTDNVITNYQGRFLEEEEFKKAYKLLIEKSPNSEQVRKHMKMGKDDIGQFIEIDLRETWWDKITSWLSWKIETLRL
jgi:Putative enzyme of poly-gamma-glutamate biosynthesis (capsule formation)